MFKCVCTSKRHTDKLLINNTNLWLALKGYGIVFQSIDTSTVILCLLSGFLMIINFILPGAGVHNTSYPRVDPSIICAVVSPTKDRCILAHKFLFPHGMHSCVAGFIEPGIMIISTSFVCRQQHTVILVSNKSAIWQR